MRFENINGKLVRVSENKTVASKSNISKSTVIKWELPTAVKTDKKRNIMDIPTMPLQFHKERKRGFLARSSTIVGAAALTVGVASNTDTGILMDTFLEYIYPWFLEVASIYALVKIAMSLYDEQRGVGNGKSAFSTVFLYGKWLLLFYMIPFFIQLLNTVGSRMAENIAQ